jgi:hypothetical protein
MPVIIVMYFIIIACTFLIWLPLGILFFDSAWAGFFVASAIYWLIVWRIGSSS